VFGCSEGENCVGLDDGDDGESLEAEDDNGVAGVSIGEGEKINGCGMSCHQAQEVWWAEMVVEMNRLKCDLRKEMCFHEK